MLCLKQVSPSSVKQLRDESFWSVDELLCVGVDPVSCTAGDKSKEFSNDAADWDMKRRRI